MMDVPENGIKTLHTDIWEMIHLNIVGKCQFKYLVACEIWAQGLKM